MRFDDESHFLGFAAQADDIAHIAATACNVALHPVHIDVAVRHDLTCGKDRRREFGAVHDHVQTTLKQADEVLTGVALHLGGVFIGRTELLLGHIAIVAFELLLGAQLQAEIAHLALATLAVLARAVRTLVDRRIGTTPDVFAHPAVKFVLGALALRHKSFLQICRPTHLVSVEPGIAPLENVLYARPPLHRGAGPIAKARP